MNYQFSSKIKLRLLIAIDVIAIIISVQFAVAKTLEIRAACDVLEMESNTENTSGKGVQRASPEDALLARSFRDFTLDTLRADKNLLAVAANYCDANVANLEEYKIIGEPAISDSGVITRTVTVQGAFSECLQLVYKIETGRKVGFIRSTEFNMFFDRRLNKKDLTCKIYVQNILVK